MKTKPAIQKNSIEYLDVPYHCICLDVDSSMFTERLYCIGWIITGHTIHDIAILKKYLSSSDEHWVDGGLIKSVLS